MKHQKYNYYLPNSQIKILKEILRKRGLTREQIIKRTGNFNQKIDDKIEKMEKKRLLTIREKKQIFDEEFKKMREGSE